MTISESTPKKHYSYKVMGGLKSDTYSTDSVQDAVKEYLTRKWEMPNPYEYTATSTFTPASTKPSIVRREFVGEWQMVVFDIESAISDMEEG